jgi:hypothetical protein
VADLRTSVARRYEDSQASSLLNALLEESKDFRQRWTEHGVSTPQCTLRRIDDERVGPIDLVCTMVLSPLSSQRLTLLQPAPGTESRRRAHPGNEGQRRGLDRAAGRSTRRPVVQVRKRVTGMIGLA